MAKKQKSLLQRSPTSSAPSTPRKSATAERIAQEKARLKKLEHELSEKLRLYAHSRQEDQGKTHSSMSPKKPSQNNKDISYVTRTEREEKQPGPDGAISDNSTYALSERQDVYSEQSNQSQERQRAVSSTKDSEMAETMELNSNAQQMERIRKLQVSVPMYIPTVKAKSTRSCICTQAVYVLLYAPKLCMLYDIYSGTLLIR